MILIILHFINFSRAFKEGYHCVSVCVKRTLVFIYKIYFSKISIITLVSCDRTRCSESSLSSLPTPSSFMTLFSISHSPFLPFHSLPSWWWRLHMCGRPFEQFKISFIFRFKILGLFTCDIVHWYSQSFCPLKPGNPFQPVPMLVGNKL